MSKIIKSLIAESLGLVIAFGRTTWVYALNFISQCDISDVGTRTADLISEISVDPLITGKELVKELTTFHGGYTLITLYSYLIDDPNSVFSGIARVNRLGK